MFCFGKNYHHQLADPDTTLQLAEPRKIEFFIGKAIEIQTFALGNAYCIAASSRDLQ